MKLSGLIYPAPNPPSYSAEKLLGELIWVPRTYLKKELDPPKVEDYIPCMYLPYIQGSAKLIIFFHGNAEDLGYSYEMLDHMRSSLKINILAVEYPSYGIY